MKRLLTATLLLVLCSSGAFAQRLQARFVTSAYAWELRDTIGSSAQHLFGYQTVQFSVAGGNLSFHTYLQGFNDFAGPLKNDPVFRAYDAYFQWTNIGSVADVSVGRQAIFAGVGTGTIDGGLASVKLYDSRVKVLGYYGLLPSPTYKFALIDKPEGNFMTGGQISATPADFAQVSVSFLQRNIKPEAYLGIRRDSLFNPYLTEITPSATAEQYISGDVSLEYRDVVSGYARYDYDLLQDKNSRVQLFARVKPFGSLGLKGLEPLSLTGEYIQREPRLLFNSIFSAFAYNTLKEYEAGAEYALDAHWQVFAKYGAVSYGGADQNQTTVGVNGEHVSLSLTRDDGDGGELSAASMNIGYPIFDNCLTPTLLLGYAHYKLSQYATKLDDALSVAFGAVYRPVRVLSFDTQIQWIQNKIYSNDVRVFIRVSYLLNQQLGIF